jgi:hypothetical protein
VANIQTCTIEGVQLRQSDNSQHETTLHVLNRFRFVLAPIEDLREPVEVRVRILVQQFEEVSFLETNGMLARTLEEDVMMFQVTDKGLEFLKDYARISSYLA